jgi:sensor histidine kinase YesM
MTITNTADIKIISTDTKTLRPNFLLVQFIFWGGYCALNLVFMGLWSAASTFLTILFIFLSLLLGLSTHGFRYLYKRHVQTINFSKTILHLIWLIPIAALSVQCILVSIMWIFIKTFPALTQGAQPITTSSLLGYAMNYCIMLTLWSTLYLLRAEFYKRRNSEIAHWQLQAQLKENELDFLRSQINSHFLFNAINNLRSLINEDAERARAGLADLSILLRGLLQNDGRELVTLRSEMEWVRGYLALEALQFEDRLSLVIDVDESLLTEKLPPLIIQTLVENAIKHGIALRRAGGTLRIDIKPINTQFWQIKVVNPLAEFQPTHTGNKIGLRNARERLYIAYGNNALIDLDINTEVIATVELPL